MWFYGWVDSLVLGADGNTIGRTFTMYGRGKRVCCFRASFTGSTVLSLKKKSKPSDVGTAEGEDHEADEGKAKKRMKKMLNRGGAEKAGVLNGLPSKKKHKIYANR